MARGRAGQDCGHDPCPDRARLVASPAFAQQQAPFTVVETGQGFTDLQEAVSSIRMGTGTIRIAPGVYRQCAVQQGGRITFRAAQRAPRSSKRPRCEDKAGLVLRGQGSTVDGLVFRGYRVPDGNGAGSAPKWAT